MSFMVTKKDMLDKYNEIWDKIKNRLNFKFHSMPVYDEKYIKAKVREFDGVIKTNCLGHKIPKEKKHYTCIACITVDSVMGMEKKNYPQVYLEEWKYKMKKTKISKFIEAELESMRHFTLNNLYPCFNNTFLLNLVVILLLIDGQSNFLDVWRCNKQLTG